MSDFLLDFRPQCSRALNRAAERLSFGETTNEFVLDERSIGLVVTQNGDPGLWSPFRADDGSVVAIAGRVAFDESQWDSGERVSGKGGLAAKVLYRMYQEGGDTALERLNGNAAVIVYDSCRQRVHLVTDPAGVFPVFEVDGRESLLYCSHPDVLAEIADERQRIDEVSLAEFILSGTVTPPFSYYERVRAADHGTVFTFELKGSCPARPLRRRYFVFRYQGDSTACENDLAEQLTVAVGGAVKRRTLPRLGPPAIALSGGLDSRVILASSGDECRKFAFTCYDEPNLELRTAEAIARSLSVRFVPFRRGRDYYADNAALGVRISGGMGSFANNHFLGVLPTLKSEGMETLLTGCYCDYLFKALPLNRRVRWLSRREELGPFRQRFYFDHFSSTTELAERARARWEARIPRELQKQDSVEAVFEIEARRTFPLCYEGDNQQRLVPQRVTGWCPPFVDRNVLEVYRRLPYHFKLNKSIFRKVATALTPGLRVPDANTGAALDASPMSEWLRSGNRRLRQTWRRVNGSVASEESWPDWLNYVRTSAKIDALWKHPNSEAMDLFRRILDTTQIPRHPGGLTSRQTFLFVGLLSLKLWFDQRK